MNQPNYLTKLANDSIANASSIHGRPTFPILDRFMNTRNLRTPERNHPPILRLKTHQIAHKKSPFVSLHAMNPILQVFGGPFDGALILLSKDSLAAQALLQAGYQLLTIGWNPIALTHHSLKDTNWITRRIKARAHP